MRNPFRRQTETAPSLRERAADLRASLARPQQPPKPVATEPEEAVDWYNPPPGFMASPAIEPFSFVRIPEGITIELGRLRGIALAEFERRTEGKASGPEAAAIRRELHLDTLSMGTFEAAHALDSGAEPATQKMRERDDAELLALAPAWQAAADLYQQRIDEQHAREIAATADGWPGPCPAGTGPEWQAWRERCDRWRERMGIYGAEAVTRAASDALYKIEDRIAGLSAASLAGLKLKARVAQRHDDTEVDWPDGLGTGLARDVLALTDAAPAGVRSPDLLTAAGIDLTAMPVRGLIALHSTVNLLGDVADAISCQPKSMTGDRWNAAGSMVNWLGNGLSDVTEAVAAEMRARGASGRIEQSQRLATLAPAILEGGDPAEVLALAREILAAVEV